MSPTYIGAMRRGIPAHRLKQIGELYPDLNRDWLVYGEGEMLNSSENKSRDDTRGGFEALLLPVEAYAGGLQMWSDGVRKQDCQTIRTPIRDAEFAIPVSGDSMEPLFHDGTTLLIRKINDRAFIPWGHAMVIDTENGVLVKNLYPDDDPDPEESEQYVVAKSLNPNYPPFKIPKSSIYGLYRVMGSMDLYTTL